MTPLVIDSWQRAWTGLGATGSGIAARDAVWSRYREPQRAYHTTQHLEECLLLFDSHCDYCKYPAEVEMALWFHDAIYDPRATDNELRSAELTESVLRQADVTLERRTRVYKLIMVTLHDAVPKDPDACLLVDIDLAIFAAAPARFAEYERQIRQEYAHVPLLVLRWKRREILTRFLEREQLYSTQVLHARLDARARRNLEHAIHGTGD